MLTNADAREVLRRYPETAAGVAVTALGNAGGFSGARLWRVKLDSRAGCLKAWPADTTLAQRLTNIHHLMQVAQQSGVGFVPAVLRTHELTTCLEWAGRLWDLQEWMPGSPDAHPSFARIESACPALARLHQAWAAEAETVARCPAIRRRLDGYEEWVALRAAGWRPAPQGSTEMAALTARAWPLLKRCMPDMAAALAQVGDRAVVAQPCLCDIWHAHVLFDGERVTGIVDFGSVKADHVATDLARYLGSVAGDDDERWARALAAYRRLRPLSADEAVLARALDRTGVLVGLFNWMKWLYRDGRTYPDSAAVTARIEALVGRIEAWDRSIIASTR